MCDEVSCRSRQECQTYNGEPYCVDSCADNGGCGDDEICELVMQTCDILPCFKKRECVAKGMWSSECGKGALCMVCLCLFLVCWLVG